jgi:hypothetical protein
VGAGVQDAGRAANGQRQGEEQRVMAGDLLRDDEGEIRLMGSQAFISAAIERIGEVLDVHQKEISTAARGGGTRP